jgi:hypothetical protein
MTTTNEVQLTDVDGREGEESIKCESCDSITIQGVFCHEKGCPDAWKNHPVKCFECGFDFIPEEKGDRTCPDCIANDSDDYGYSDQKNFD